MPRFKRHQNTRLVEVPQVIMAASDVAHKKAGSLKSADELARRDDRQTGHTPSTATVMVSFVERDRGCGPSGGAGKPSFARLSR